MSTIRCGGEWNKIGIFYITRLNNNATYTVLKETINHISEYADGGILSDNIIMLGEAKARLITYKDPNSSNILKFVSNMFEYNASTITQLYKYRWNIEVLFKRLKQNFELGYFFSDSLEGIKTQVWIALIANLLFSVIHKQTKESENFSAIVSLASKNMGSYVSLIKIVKEHRLEKKGRNLEIIQKELFDLKKKMGGVFLKIKKNSLKNAIKTLFFVILILVG